LEQLVQEACQWHLTEEAGVETTSLEVIGLQRQDELVVFKTCKMARRTRSNKGGNSKDNNEDDKDCQMTDASTKTTGSKWAPDGSLTPERNRQSHQQKTSALTDETAQETQPAQVTPAGAKHTAAEAQTEGSLSMTKWPLLTTSPT
jgi:hypothetical protein